MKNPKLLSYDDLPIALLKEILEVRIVKRLDLEETDPAYDEAEADIAIVKAALLKKCMPEERWLYTT